MSRQWFVQLTNNIAGPLTSRDLQEMATLGSLTPETLVSPDRQRWTMALHVKGLAFQVPCSDIPLNPPEEVMNTPPAGDATTLREEPAEDLRRQTNSDRLEEGGSDNLEKLKEVVGVLRTKGRDRQFWFSALFAGAAMIALVAWYLTPKTLLRPSPDRLDASNSQKVRGSSKTVVTTPTLDGHVQKTENGEPLVPSPFTAVNAPRAPKPSGSPDSKSTKRLATSIAQGNGQATTLSPDLISRSDISVIGRYKPREGDVLAFSNGMKGDPDSPILVSPDKELTIRFGSSLRYYQPEYKEQYPKYKDIEVFIKNGKILEIPPATRLQYGKEEESADSYPVVNVLILEGRYKGQEVWTSRVHCCRIYTKEEKEYLQLMANSGRSSDALDHLSEKWKNEK